MKTLDFLKEWRSVRQVFVRPKFQWYFGTWMKEPNLPVWRRGPQIHIGKRHEVNEKWNYGKLENSEWNEIGKKNHPIISKIFKHPTIQLPIWLSFYIFDSDIVYKTKWTDDDFRYEYPAHVTIVFFGLALSVSAYIPQENENDWTCNDDYWEALLTFKYCNGDIEKTNDILGMWKNSTGLSFRLQPRFLKNAKDRDKLISIQKNKMKEISDQKDTNV